MRRLGSAWRLPAGFASHRSLQLSFVERRAVATHALPPPGSGGKVDLPPLPPAPETALTALCTGGFAKLARAFTDADGDSMTVAHLQGFTEATLMSFVERKGSSDGLVPSWLDANNLRPLLRVDRGHSASTAAVDPQLLPLGDLSTMLVPAAEVPLPSMLVSDDQNKLVDPPPFVNASWLVDTMELVKGEWRRSESDDYRKRPMALVRCSRGGKTRALKEIAHRLHRDLPGTAVIFVSFNGNTGISEWEQADPLAALCRRIAFAARQRPDPTKEMDQFEAFKFAVASSDQIKQWLGDTPCVLLIDELNLFSHLRDASFGPGTAFAAFLKVGVVDPLYVA
jgi:hypothetical protein